MVSLHLLGHAALEDLADIAGCDGLAVPVLSSFGNDDDAVAAPRFAALTEPITQAGAPSRRPPAVFPG